MLCRVTTPALIGSLIGLGLFVLMLLAFCASCTCGWIGDARAKRLEKRQLRLEKAAATQAQAQADADASSSSNFKSSSKGVPPSPSASPRKSTSSTVSKDGLVELEL